MMEELIERIKKYKDITPVDGVILPNNDSIELSLEVIIMFGNLDIIPVINLSPEGGIIFEFFINKQYLLLEITNAKKIILLEKARYYLFLSECNSYDSIGHLEKRLFYLISK